MTTPGVGGVGVDGVGGVTGVGVGGDTGVGVGGTGSGEGVGVGTTPGQTTFSKFSFTRKRIMRHQSEENERERCEGYAFDHRACAYDRSLATKTKRARDLCKRRTPCPKGGKGAASAFTILRIESSRKSEPFTFLSA